MKKVVVCMLTVATFFYAKAQNKSKPAAKPAVVKPVAKGMFKNLLDSFSYAAGYNVANNMKAQGISNLNSALMQKAIDDVFKNRKSVLGEQEINSCLQSQLQLFAKAKEDVAKKGAGAEIERGRAFLEANKKRSGVITLPNGLQYEVLKKADSATARPLLTDNVTVNYIGTLTDGREFDNSYKRGQPATFGLTNVIKGWTEILQLMSVGDKWKVYIPTELGYNLSPRDPNQIPPGAALIFEISLEGINTTKGQ